MTTEQELQWLTRKLYPNGRAFRMPEGGDLYKLHEAINQNIAQLDEDSLNILDCLMPDNANFTQADATRWYQRLGIFDSGSVPFADMKLAIAQKQSFPLVPLDKQSPAFIEAQLQAAGFDVIIVRNNFAGATKTAFEYYGNAMGYAGLGNFYLDELELDSEWIDDSIEIVANNLDAADDAEFGFGDNLRSTFFVHGPLLLGSPTQANILTSRKTEFRQLLLKLKAQQAIGILWVNYI